MVGPDIDAEIIQVAAALWQSLGLTDFVKLELNNIGSADDRKAFGSALTAYLEQHLDALDEDARRRMHTNPMRVLDSKNPAVQAVLSESPTLKDFVNADSVIHFDRLLKLLGGLGINYEINPRLVRGLDYYNNCVFEWTTDKLGAQGAVCGGGRYDGLVAQLGGKATVAAGFAIGIERLVLMLEELQLIPDQVKRPIDVYVLAVGGDLSEFSLQVAAAIRTACPSAGIVSHCGGGKYNSQIKRAFAAGARYAVVLEASADGEPPGNAKLRILDDSGDAQAMAIEVIPAEIQRLLCEPSE
jgi:histidyl-tRNA synthetase